MTIAADLKPKLFRMGYIPHQIRLNHAGFFALCASAQPGDLCVKNKKYCGVQIVLDENYHGTEFGVI